MFEKRNVSMVKNAGMNTLVIYLLLVLVFSIPFWMAAYFLDAKSLIPVNLPFSALQFFAVIVAAILVTRIGGGSIRKLLLRGLDAHRIRKPLWLVFIVLIMPVIVGLSYLLSLLSCTAVSERMTPLLSLPVFLLIYGFAGYCEETGWTAVMADGLLKNHTIIVTGIIIGVPWALWHVIPLTQAHNTAAWIFWQCAFTIISRLIITRIYVWTNSVFSAIAIHATYNTAFSMLPYYGSSYDPMYMTIVAICVTVVVFILLSRQSRNKYRFSNGIERRSE